MTLPLYGPRTYRADDYNDPIHLERISTLNMFITKVNTCSSNMYFTCQACASPMCITCQTCPWPPRHVCVNCQECASTVNHPVRHVPGRHVSQLTGMCVNWQACASTDRHVRQLSGLWITLSGMWLCITCQICASNARHVNLPVRNVRRMPGM